MSLTSSCHPLWIEALIVTRCLGRLESCLGGLSRDLLLISG